MKAGRRLTVCAGDVAALRSGTEHPVATMLATMAALHDVAEISPGGGLGLIEVRFAAPR